MANEELRLTDDGMEGLTIPADVLAVVQIVSNKDKVEMDTVFDPDNSTVNTGYRCVMDML